jgi:hypothetical protein
VSRHIEFRVNKTMSYCNFQYGFLKDCLIHHAILKLLLCCDVSILLLSLQGSTLKPLWKCANLICIVIFRE